MIRIQDLTISYYTKSEFGLKKIESSPWTESILKSEVMKF